ncbi:MAG: hypothetical protein NZ602_00820 [Thermoguttaceae bacterium]|nr:hypothetical protein [Thermoguttaceae bacterium]MDW8038095.1 hypothetical protein [Thermoguttaceae bacterium]
MAKGKNKVSGGTSEGKNVAVQEAMGKEGGSESVETRGVVVMDRRRGGDRRSGQDRRSRQEPVLVERRQLERRAKTPRRRQIDPTTCERDYTPEEIEFMRALDEYKRSSGRMFPTCSEILEVLRKLGYEKRSSASESSSAQASAELVGPEATPSSTPSLSVAEKQEVC